MEYEKCGRGRLIFKVYIVNVVIGVKVLNDELIIYL